MSTTIRRDLSKRIHERHRQWITDSFALYDMAALPRIQAAGDIVGILLASLCAAFEAYGIEPTDAHRVLERWLRRQAEEDC